MSDTDDIKLDDIDDLGPCCICEGTAAVGFAMLNVKAQVPDHGWGCITCDLPCDGAVAVLCDPCGLAYENGTPLRFACRGYPASDGRVPIEALTERHDHDPAKHAADGEPHE